MLRRILNWISIQKESNEESTTNPLWLQAMLLVALIMIGLFWAFSEQVGTGPEVRVFLLGFSATLLVLLALFRTGHSQLAGTLFGFSTFIGLLFAAFFYGGVQSSSYFALIVPLAIIALYFRGRITIIATSLAVLFGSALVWAEYRGWYRPNLTLVYSLESWISAAFIFIFIATFVGIARRTTRHLLASNALEIQERRKAESMLQAQSTFLAALHETTLAIINRLELGPLLDSILNSALGLTNTDHGYIDMLGPHQGDLTTSVARGVFTRWINVKKKPELGVSGYIIQTGTTLVLSDYATWPRRIPKYAEGFHALAAVPMKAQGEIIGIIGLGYVEPGREFTPKQISALEQFAELAALAVVNAHLYQSAQDELSERKRIQEALAESEENLRLALEAAQMGTWSWNIATNKISWSNAVYKLFGINKNEMALTYLSYLDYIHPDDRPDVEKKVQQSLDNPALFYAVEHRVIWPDGSLHWMAGQGRVYTNDSGQLVRMAGTVIDITERKLAEAALQQANQQLENNTQMLERRSILLQVAAEVSRAASAILDSNELSQQVVELVQQRFNLYYVGLFMSDETSDMLYLRAATGQAGREMLQNGHKLQIGNTSMVGWCVANRQARIALIADNDDVRFNNPRLPASRSELALPLISRGQVLGALTIQSEHEAAFSDEDIETFQTMADQLANAILNARLYDQLEKELEERKHAETQVRQLNAELEARVERRTLALKASEETFRALSENNPLRIRRYDHDGRVLYANAVSSRSDFKPENIIGHTIDEFIRDAELVEFAKRCIREVFDTGQPLNTEYKIDESFASWWLAPEFGPDGKVISVVTTAMDITERRRMEDELRARSLELQATNRELESFSYSVSHDLRAPLRALDGFSRILLDDFQASLPEDGQAHLNRIREAAKQMSQLIDDMLRLSRVTRTEMHYDPVDLTSIAKQVIEALQDRHPGRNVTVSVHENLTAHGDEGLLRMAFENLLSNAWKFSEKAAQPEIEVGMVNLQGQETFFIRDNGVGFDMAYADKLFSAFQRLHSPQDFPGTGIGLAIVQRVIHRHGGKIWAASQPGQGATFFFTL